jgi:hypothetical protein
MPRPLFRKQGHNGGSVPATPSSPLASAMTNISDFSSPPPSPQTGSSDVQLHVGNDTDQDTDTVTEEEDNSEVEQYYLAKPNSKSRDVDTVFGKGIGVWKSHGGTVNTYIVGETINGEVMMPRKRKRTQRLTEEDNNGLSEPRENHANHIPDPYNLALPGRPAPLPLPITALRARDPACVSTIFHHGSAAINPLGAYTRPPVAVPNSSPPEKRRRVVSGSFGTFAGAPGRFDERPYCLLLGRKDGKEQKERMMFKARPWVRQ